MWMWIVNELTIWNLGYFASWRFQSKLAVFDESEDFSINDDEEEESSVTAADSTLFWVNGISGFGGELKVADIISGALLYLKYLSKK
jgi:hypothetical protein